MAAGERVVLRKGLGIGGEPAFGDLSGRGVGQCLDDLELGLAGFGLVEIRERVIGRLTSSFGAKSSRAGFAAVIAATAKRWCPWASSPT